MAYLLVLRHARTSTPLQEHRPSSATALLTSEGIRLAVSLTFALYEIISDPRTPDTSTATSLFGRLARAVFSSDSWKMVIPALLYTLKNSLQYVAANNLDSQTFEGVSQIRSLLVALFSTVLLGRTLSLSQWTSVLLLMGGVAMVEFSGGADLSPILSMKDLKDGTAFHEARNIWGLKAAGNAAAGHLARRSATYEGIDEDTAVVHPELHHFVGIPTLVIASIASSLAGVYFEKVLKGYRSDHAASVWIRSVQLSFYSIWPALLLSLLFSGESTSLKAGLFDGYNVATWLAIILHAAGGLLVAFVIKHANNVAKEFAIGVSVITGSLVSVSLFDVQLNRLVCRNPTRMYSSLISCSSQRAQALSSWQHSYTTQFRKMKLNQDRLRSGSLSPRKMIKAHISIWSLSLRP